MLVVIITVFAVFIILVFGNVKELVTRSCDYTVSAFAESVNKDIIQIENNVIDLALLGEVYYMYGRDKDMLEYSVKEIFECYKPALGGGVWFKPYILNPYKKYGSLYVFRDSNGLTKIDRIYETASYDYPSKSWYKEITGGIKKELDIWWTK
ncbi:hypothetical protein II810_01215, partial [bacterium]|nr:hypothetical protein [bacterium]